MHVHPRKRTAPTDWGLANPVEPPSLRRSHLASSLFARPFSRQTALAAHHSCVNALALSRGDDPRWLATGGDDLRVLLWDTNALDDDDGPRGRSGLAKDPVGCYRGARSNIFAIAFSADNSRIFSGGNDAVILAHDLETSSATFPHSLKEGVPPLDAWLDHDDAVTSLSAHPHHPSLFLSSSSDGSLHAFDTRTSPGRVGTILDTCGMNDVVHHPLSPELFLYSGEDGQMGLIDGRMGWGGGGHGGGRGEEVRIAKEVAVVRYDTSVSRKVTRNGQATQQTARPNVSSSALSPSGALVCATLSGHLPTLYELSSARPLATFSSPAPPPPPTSSPDSPAAPPRSFPRGYRNTATTKHGSFGGGRGAEPGRGLYYAAGSDDFAAYVWEVPSLEAMREGRKEVRSEEIEEGRVAFLHPTSSTSRGPSSLEPSAPRRPHGHGLTLPARVSPAHATLRAHRSIVNTALFHPTLPVLYTGGVEKLVVRHAPQAVPAVEQGDGDGDGEDGATPRARRRRTWTFTPRVPATHASHPGLLGPPDPALDPSLGLSGSAAEEEEARLCAEDTAVLEYFDGLVEGEDEEGELWAGEGAGTSSSEEEEEGEEGDEERWAAEGGWGVPGSGTTRRILRAIYALEAEQGRSSDDEGGRQAAGSSETDDDDDSE